jgi:hypothetical protein
MAQKATRFLSLYMIGGVAGAAVLAEATGVFEVAGLFMILWFLAFGVLQFTLLRCPHCGGVAIITPEGIATPFVGSECRRCGKPY